MKMELNEAVNQLQEAGAKLLKEGGAYESFVPWLSVGYKKAVEEIKKGKVTYRTDKEGNIACMIGKTSFTAEQLAENWQALYEVILKARPAAVKGQYIKNVVLTASMAPSIKVDHAV